MVQRFCHIAEFVSVHRKIEKNIFTFYGSHEPIQNIDIVEILQSVEKVLINDGNGSEFIGKPVEESQCGILVYSQQPLLLHKLPLPL